MNFNIKKVGVFIVSLIFISTILFVLLNFVLPIKTTMISGNVGCYKSRDILFYSESDSYVVEDVILYNPSTQSSTLIVEIIEINPDGTFKVIGINPEPIDDLDQNNLEKDQIIGKVIYSLSPLIYFPIFFIIVLLLAYNLTRFISNKIKI